MVAPRLAMALQRAALAGRAAAPGSLLQPLLPPGGAAPGGGAGALPGDEVAEIAAASTSLATTTGGSAGSAPAVAPSPSPSPVLAAPAPIDVVATEVAAPLPAASAARNLGSHWVKVVGVCAFAAFLCYLDRTNISTAIVPMAEQYGWDKQFCGAVLSAFFAGYGLTQVLGGTLSDKYGGGAVLAAGLGVWSLATALTPLAASAGTVPLLGARTLLGMAQGVAFPAMHALLARHVPGKVRSGAIGIIMALAHCGTALGFGASPAIIDALGWGWTYYLFGGAALLWLPAWLSLGRERARATAGAAATVAAAAAAAAAAARGGGGAATAAAAAAAGGSNNVVRAPGLAAAGAVLCTGDAARGAAGRGGAHPLLDALEQQHLVAQGAAAAQTQQTQQQQTQQTQQQAAGGAPNVGFWPLMRRKEVWAIAVAQYTAGWGFYGLLAWLPSFFLEHCGLQLSQLGGFTLAPYLLQAAVGASAGLLADNLLTKRRWAVRDVRVLMQVAGMLGPAACLFAAASPLSAHSPYMATGLITLGMGMSALTCSGVSASHLDIAPRHAGVVFGVGNTAGTLAGLVAVPGLGYVLQHTGNWSLAFGLAAAHNVVGAALWARWVGDRPLPEDGGEEEPARQLAAPAPPAQALVIELGAPSAAGGGLKDACRWLSAADLRRARLVCKAWLKALAALATRATTPPEPASVSAWKGQLELMALALPCLQELTIGGRLSAVGAQQLGALAAARQLRALHIPHGQALQDRSLQALHPLAPTLRELRIRGAASLSPRALLLLAALGNLEVLELRHCGKVGWRELHDAWRAACAAYEADGSGGGSGSGGSGGGGVASRLGGWLPGGGRLFRTSSSASGGAAPGGLVRQRSGAAGLLARMAQGRSASAGAAQLAKGAVGNGRSSSGGGSQDGGGGVRRLLYRKQKQQQQAAAAAAAACEPAFIDCADEPADGEPACADGSRGAAGAAGGGQPAGQGLPPPLGGCWSISAGQPAPRAASAPPGAPGAGAAPSVLYSAVERVGSLVRQSTTAAAAALSSGSLGRQSTSVQAALLAYLAGEEGGAEFCGGGGGGSGSGDGGGGGGGGGAGAASRFSRRRASADKPLPAMPFPRLRSLAFTCSEVTFKSPGPELAAVAALTGLTSLELGNAKLPDAALWRLAGLTRLAKLKLCGLWATGDTGLAELAKLTSLRALTLTEAMHATAAGLLALRQLSGLTSLSLGLTQDLGPGAIGRAAAALPALRCLEVTAPCWGDVDCELLAAAAAPPPPAGTAAAAAAAAPPPHMLWSLACAAPSPTSPRGPGAGRSASSRQLLGGGAPALSASSSRSNSSHNLAARAPSFGSTRSFGSFSSCAVPAAAPWPGAAAAPPPQQLAVLRLHGCAALGPGGLSALRALRGVTALVLDGCKAVAAAEALAQDLLPPALCSLALKALPWGNAFTGCVAAPACGGGLTRLELAGVSGVHCGQLRRLLGALPGLRELSLAGCPDVGDAAARHAAACTTRLEALSLAGTRAGGAVVEALGGLPRLRSLCLRGAGGLAGDGAGLDAAVRALPALEELDLSDCALSAAGLARALAGAAAGGRLVSLDARVASLATEVSAPPATASDARALGVDGLMLQGFGWTSHKTKGWYNVLASKVPDIQAAGFSHVWLPPPSNSVAPEGYMPGQLYNLSSAYGNEAELVALTAALKAAGVCPIADIVINHRCADTQDAEGRWNRYADDHDHEGHAIDWGQWAITSDDKEFGGQGNRDTGDDFWGAPDLDHANPHLREALVHWLQHLRDNVGFTGWRFDFARGYGAQFIKQYVHDSGAGTDLNVGELWVDLQWEDGGVLGMNQDAARQRLCDWIDGTQRSATAFDFVTKGVLQEALRKCEYHRLRDGKGKAPGLIGWWPSKAVTFIDNHDTGSAQAHWPFPSGAVGQGYAYLLTHPGMPCVFYEHFFDWGSGLRGEIDALIKVRRDAGIVARSKLEILAAKGDMYVARVTGGRGAVVVKLGPRLDMGDLLPPKDQGWVKAASGKDYAVWARPHAEGEAAPEAGASRGGSPSPAGSADGGAPAPAGADN
ncbi:AMY1.2 [Scenedesmus sp. PABB004]|nr:AMY1.2 [Scenedesmus sp. PABB004]